jgi:hypothetical protein
MSSRVLHCMALARTDVSEMEVICSLKRQFKLETHSVVHQKTFIIYYNKPHVMESESEFHVLCSERE